MPDQLIPNVGRDGSILKSLPETPQASRRRRLGGQFRPGKVDCPPSRFQCAFLSDERPEAPIIAKVPVPDAIVPRWKPLLAAPIEHCLLDVAIGGDLRTVVGGDPYVGVLRFSARST